MAVHKVFRNLDKVLAGIERKGVVHVGAHKGQEVPAYKAAGFEHIVLIDANIGIAQGLTEAFPDCVVIPCAIGKGPAVLPFYKTEWDQLRSLLKLKKKASYTYVPCLPLTMVPLGDANVLVMDIQGGELDALQGADLSRFDCIILEVIANSSRYRNMPTEADVVQYCDAYGFTVVSRWKHPNSQASDIVLRRKQEEREVVEYSLRETLSLFLAYRRFFPIKPCKEKVKYDDEFGLLDYIRESFKGKTGKIGCALSGGMDSALIASCLREGDTCYTLTYPGDRGEFPDAKKYILPGVEHKEVHVTKEQYIDELHLITEQMRLPVVPHQPLASIIAKRVKEDGCEWFTSGFGDGAHGGRGFLHTVPRRRDFEAELLRFQINPRKVLVDPCSIEWVIDAYTENDVVNVTRFLREVGTEGTAVADTINQIVKIKNICPFAEIEYSKEYPVGIKPGKPHISRAYTLVYGTQAPRKKALSAPYAQWSIGWRPSRPEFKADLTMKPGKKMCMLYGIEAWLNLVDPI